MRFVNVRRSVLLCSTALLGACIASSDPSDNIGDTAREAVEHAPPTPAAEDVAMRAVGREDTGEDGVARAAGRLLDQGELDDPGQAVDEPNGAVDDAVAAEEIEQADAERSIGTSAANRSTDCTEIWYVNGDCGCDAGSSCGYTRYKFRKNCISTAPDGSCRFASCSGTVLESTSCVASNACTFC